MLYCIYWYFDSCKVLTCATQVAVTSLSCSSSSEGCLDLRLIDFYLESRTKWEIDTWVLLQLGEISATTKFTGLLDLLHAPHSSRVRASTHLAERNFSAGSNLYATLLLTVMLVGYEPAGLTMHPPPQNDRGWVHFFRIGV